jgi:hypothetical protein
MDTITFKCPSCKFALKVAADKAGRKAKCTKCGAALTVPAKSETAPAATAAKKSPLDDDDDGPLTYTLKADTGKGEIPDPTERTELGTIRGPGRRFVKKEAIITDAAEWRRVGFGTQIIAGGLIIWAMSFMLYRVPLVLGTAVGEQYAYAADDRLVVPNTDGPPDLDQSSYAIVLVAGDFWGTFMIWIVRLSQVLVLLQTAMLVGGYIICLVAPERYGTRLQLFTLIGLAMANLFFLLIFKLLPMFGLYTYTIIPFAVPEVVMMEMNAERVETIGTFWMRWPMLEYPWAIIMTILLYLEPAMIAVFLNSVSMGIKSHTLEKRSNAAMQLGFSQIFIQVVWLMAALCGTSIVLLWVLRFVYAIGVFFFLYQLTLTVIGLFGVPGQVEVALGDEDFDEDEDEDEEEREEEDEEEEEDED